MMNLPPISPKQATQFMRQYHSNIPPTSSEDLLLVGPGGLAHIRKEWVAEYEKYEQELKDAEDCEASQLDFIETYNGGNVNGFVAAINNTKERIDSVNKKLAEAEFFVFLADALLETFQGE